MRVAIVGTGISGLAVAHGLHERHDVVLFEAAEWIGGHTHTVPVAVEGRSYAVDTGFIVYNEGNYPRFSRLLAELGVSTQPSDMSFAVSCEATGLEYGTRSLGALLARRSNALRPGFLRVLRDHFHFAADARRLLAAPDEKVTLGDFARGRGYSAEFLRHYLVPMGAAIWSAEPARLLAFPALAFVRFFANHGLLSRGQQARWRVVSGGSQRYVDRLVTPFRGRVRTGCAVHRVARGAQGAEVTSDAGVERFDEVVFAVHSDQALALLADARDAERAVLGAIRYQPNEVLLHTDTSVLPRRRRAWASWNYHVPAAPQGRATVTYHMNRLQGIDAPVDLCVTLNDARVDPRKVLARFEYAHPVYDAAAFRAQREHARVSGRDHTHYCGAYWGYGFHEDGVRSALAVLHGFPGARRW